MSDLLSVPRLCVVTAALVVTTFAFAQGPSCEAPPYDPTCEAAPNGGQGGNGYGYCDGNCRDGRCGFHGCRGCGRRPCCCPPVCQPPCQPPGQPPRTPRDIKQPPGEPREGPPAGDRQMQETGVFVAPPRSGSTIGPVNRFGIEGMSVTFPEMRLSLPRVELPSLFRSRTEARMALNPAEAPYVRTGYTSTGPSQRELWLEDQVAQMRAASQERDDRAVNQQQRDLNPQSDRAATSRSAEDFQRQLEDLRRAYNQCEAEKKRLEELQRCIEECQRNFNASQNSQLPQPPPDQGAWQRLPQVQAQPVNYQQEMGPDNVIREPRVATKPVMGPRAEIKGLRPIAK